jgi:diaminohydroxyphosphoribosylaminopyrimidine deaminase/5-amino-6-(5-phosphoribosylamino)uracil reductase
MVIDPKNELPAHLTVFQDGLPVVIFNQQEDGVQGAVIRFKLEDKDWMESLFTYCRRHQIQSILVEGGRATLLHFLQQGCWDEIRRVTNLNWRDVTGIPAPDISTYHLDNDKVEIIYRMPISS